MQSLFSERSNSTFPHT